MFQQSVNITQALAVEGDFAGANPRFSVASQNDSTSLTNNTVGFRAAPAGAYVGRFAWADATNTLVANVGSGLPTGFIARTLNATNFNYFAIPGSATTFFIPGGFMVGDIFNGGIFWVRNAGAGAVTVAMKAFTKNANTSVSVIDGGQIQFAAAGATVAGYTETKWFAASTGATTELIKMSSQAPG